MIPTSVPVLFITFARPEYARKVFDQIKIAKPKTLYFYSNKARDDADELKKNIEVRSYIHEIDWDCKLHTYFREEYVDVYTSFLGALDWVFSTEEDAIILEEDCVPSLAFFDFCEKLLPKFKHDNRVWLITGDNFYPEYNPSGYDYIFTRYPYQWGWATWRSRWEQVLRSKIPWQEMKDYKLYYQLFPDSKEAKYRIDSDNQAYKSVSNNPCWDLLFGFTVKMNGGFGIIPKINLVSNIGTHGIHSNKINDKVNNKAIPSNNMIDYPLLNPSPFVVPDYRYDRYFHKHYYKKKTFLCSLIHKIRRIFSVYLANRL